MIDVIEEKPKRKCTCLHCYSKLAYDQEDVHNLESYDRPLLRSVGGYIICPVCGNNIYVVNKSTRYLTNTTLEVRY